MHKIATTNFTASFLNRLTCNSRMTACSYCRQFFGVECDLQWWSTVFKSNRHIY